jgi:hypothetical protein
MLVSRIWNVANIEYYKDASMVSAKLIYDDFVVKHQLI